MKNGGLRHRKIIRVEQALTAKTGDDFLVVTGELGDQIFGSALLAVFTQSAEPEKPVVQVETTSDFWRVAMPHVMEELGAVPYGYGKQWLSFVEPQVACAPFPIKTVFDFLWWVNISCVWQADTLRIPNVMNNSSAALMDRVVHFYRTDDFQKWSFTNHEKKMPQLNIWTSWKVSPECSPR